MVSVFVNQDIMEWIAKLNVKKAIMVLNVKINVLNVKNAIILLVDVMESSQNAIVKMKAFALKMDHVYVHQDIMEKSAN